MAYNLTEKHKEVARWLVDQVRKDMLPEEFSVIWATDGSILFLKPGAQLQFEDIPEITTGAFDVLEKDHLVLITRRTPNHFKCTILAKIYEAVDTDFDTPDISFVKNKSGPLALPLTANQPIA